MRRMIYSVGSATIENEEKGTSFVLKLFSDSPIPAEKQKLHIESSSFHAYKGNLSVKVQAKVFKSVHVSNITLISSSLPAQNIRYVHSRCNFIVDTEEVLHQNSI